MRMITDCSYSISIKRNFFNFILWMTAGLDSKGRLPDCLPFPLPVPVLKHVRL